MKKRIGKSTPNKFSVMQHGTRALERESYRIMRECPRFVRCSVPICPLDLLQDERDHIKGEPACTLSKARRYAIGKDTDLPLQGLTKREWAGRSRWDKLSEDERQSQIARLGQFSSICPGNLKVSSASSVKGPPLSNQAQKPRTNGVKAAG